MAVIWNDHEQILIDRRLPKGVMGGLWEFPGGKIEPGETIEECIQREIREELGIGIEVGKHFNTARLRKMGSKIKRKVFADYLREQLKEGRLTFSF